VRSLIVAAHGPALAARGRSAGRLCSAHVPGEKVLDHLPALGAGEYAAAMPGAVVVHERHFNPGALERVGERTGERADANYGGKSRPTWAGRAAERRAGGCG